MAAARNAVRRRRRPCRPRRECRPGPPSGRRPAYGHGRAKPKGFEIRPVKGPGCEGDGMDAPRGAQARQGTRRRGSPMVHATEGRRGRRQQCPSNAPSRQHGNRRHPRLRQRDRCRRARGSGCSWPHHAHDAGTPGGRRRRRRRARGAARGHLCSRCAAATTGAVHQPSDKEGRPSSPSSTRWAWTTSSPKVAGHPGAGGRACTSCAPLGNGA